MRSSMRKTTLREIKNSFGRWLAILAIVALGVGFFSGLMTTTPSMLQTGNDYINGHDLYDLRLLSTLGFDRDAVDLFLGEETLAAAEGAVSTDFLAQIGEEETRVLSAQTLLAVQNQVELVEGRMPETAAECVVDANLTDAPVGTLIRVSGENEETRRELFSQNEYVVVGRVNSVSYVQYERGSSSLGNGKIAGFVYLLPEGFTGDCYTEIFLRLARDEEIYSDAYKEKIEALKEWAQPLTDAAAQERYQRILDEAKDKLDEAQAELDRQKKDARQELDDAAEKIRDGQAQLTEAQQQLDDGRSELSRARRELTEGQNELETNAAQLARAREQIEAGLAQISPAIAQLSMAQGETGEAALQLQELTAQEGALRQQLSQIQAQEAQLEEGRRQLAASQNEIAAHERELEENRERLEQSQEELEKARREYEDGEQELQQKTREAQEELEEAREELDGIEAPKTYVLGRDTNVGYVCFENDSAIVRGIARVFPVFFFLVAALVCVTTMNRMVEEQRTQIGVLKALGYSENRVMGKYLFYSGSAAVLGSILGFAVGSVVFPNVIWQAYKIMYRMGEIRIHPDWKMAFLSLGMALLCSMGTTWLTCRYELSSAAALLIRPKAPKSGKRILLERFPAIWSHLSFLVKVSVRNVMRYKRRFFMMVVGIGGCTALLVTGFGIKDSIADVARQQFEEIQKYEMSLTLTDGGEEKKDRVTDLAMQNGAAGYTQVSEKAMDLTGPEMTKSVNVIIPRDPQEIGAFVDLHTEAGDPIDWPQEGEAVLTQEVADKCGIQEGDTVSLRNEDGESLHVVVTALARNYVFEYVYVNAETWKKENGDLPEFKSIYLNTAEETDARKLSGILLANDDVSAVTVNQDLMDRVDRMMGSLDYIVLLIIVCAAALAFIVIYNLTNINITERIREIATIKVLGFYPGETAAYVFRENVVLTAVGALLGQGLGVLLHRFVMSQIRVDMVSFHVCVLPPSFLKSVVLTFLFMGLVDIFMYLKLEHIDMAESLKSVE